jgi:hypothetical protein
MQSTGPLADPYLEALYQRTKPSLVYRQSLESPVYRLSESMFGSLLASYVVGFIGLIAAQLAGPSLGDVIPIMKALLPGVEIAGPSPNQVMNVMKVLLPSIQYAFVSVAFAYLTASLYLTYHAGILTMQLPLSRLGFDFALSIVQPFFFGFSMLFPGWFPVLLGVLLLAVSFRQYRGHRELAASFFRRICKRQLSIDEEVSREEVNDEDFRKNFANLLKKKEYNELSGWKSANGLVIIFSVIIILCGLAIWYLVSGVLPKDLWLRQGWHLPENWLSAQLLVTAESILVGCFVIWRGHQILRDRSTFLYVKTRSSARIDEVEKADIKATVAPGEEETNRMDRQFKILLEALNESCKQ